MKFFKKKNKVGVEIRMLNFEAAEIEIWGQRGGAIHAHALFAHLWQVDNLLDYIGKEKCKEYFNL